MTLIFWKILPHTTIGYFDGNFVLYVFMEMHFIGPHIFYNVLIHNLLCVIFWVLLSLLCPVREKEYLLFFLMRVHQHLLNRQIII